MTRRLTGIILLGWIGFGASGRLAAQVPLDDQSDATVQVLRGFAINGRLATRGVVLRTPDGRVADDGNGQRTWVEYDDYGRRSDLGRSGFKQDTTLTVMSLAEHCADQHPYPEHPTAAQITEADTHRKTCRDDHPGIRSVLTDGKRPPERVYMSRRQIAFETDFFTIDPSESGANLVNPGCIVDESKLSAGTNIDMARAQLRQLQAEEHERRPEIARLGADSGGSHRVGEPGGLSDDVHRCRRVLHGDIHAARE